MDGMLTEVVGQVVVDQGPRPFTTSDAMAARVVGEAHARAMAEQARTIAAEARPNPAFRLPPAWNPSEAALAAEIHHRTVEARRVFHADKLRGLLDAGRLTRAEYRAATEIGDLLEWAEGGRQVLARSQFRERLAASTGEGLVTQERLEEAERARFMPWRTWAAAFPVKVDRSLADLTLTMVKRRFGLRQLAITFAMDQRRAEALLRRSLACYAALAGWDRDKDA